MSELVQPEEVRKEITVVWSGGFDSTALLCFYLEQNYKVHALSARLANNQGQSNSEGVARDFIWGRLKGEFGEQLGQHVHVEVPRMNSGGSSYRLIQPPLWVVLASMAAPTDKVAMGWVRGDDAWHYRGALIELRDALNRFRQHDRFYDFEWPFEWATKPQLLQYLVKRNWIFHAVSVCEGGFSWSTCRCKKCREMQELAEKMRRFDDAPRG